MKKHYLLDNDLLYQIIISKAKGDLTKEAKDYLVLLATHVFQKKQHHIYDPKTREDCFQSGVLQLLTNWKSFNEKKFDKAIPYFTELFKRSIAESINIWHDRKLDKNGNKLVNRKISLTILDYDKESNY